MTDYLQDAICALRAALDFCDIEVVPVWFAKVADNWKAILITDRPCDDHTIYEVTHIGSEDKTIVDRYVKSDKVIL